MPFLPCPKWRTWPIDLTVPRTFINSRLEKAETFADIAQTCDDTEPAVRNRTNAQKTVVC